MIKFIEEKQIPLAGMTLLISGISIGNIPAITCDQIIIHNNFKRIAYLQTTHLEPAIGYLPQTIQNGSLGLPAQLYSLGNLLILQFRAMCRFARKKDLATQIVEQFSKVGVKQLIVISSLPYSLRPDLQIRSVSNNIYFKTKGTIKDLKLIENQEHRLYSIDRLKDEDDDQKQVLRYGGIAYQVLQAGENVAQLFIFSQDKQEKALAAYYEKCLVKLLNRKQLALI